MFIIEDTPSVRYFIPELPSWQSDPDDDKKKYNREYPDPERDIHTRRFGFWSLRMRHLLLGLDNKSSPVPAPLAPVLGTEIPASYLIEITASALWAPAHTCHIPGEAINIPLVWKRKQPPKGISLPQSDS